MFLITIANWVARYEVSSKGREAKPGDDLQISPLKYIRQKVRGRSQGVGYRKLRQLVGPDHIMTVIGIFGKLLEIAGERPRELRGQLLNENDKPASIQDLAFILDVPESQIAMAIDALSNEKIGWIKKTNTIELNINKTNTIKGFPENPGDSGKFGKTEEKNINSGFCLREIKKILNTMGIVNVGDRNRYALEIHNAGLTDKDVEAAARTAIEKAGNGQTKGSEYLGGIEGQGSWTKELQIEALKYMRGILNKQIRSK